jgi:hypothetical protein
MAYLILKYVLSAALRLSCAATIAAYFVLLKALAWAGVKL